MSSRYLLIAAGALLTPVLAGVDGGCSSVSIITDNPNGTGGAGGYVFLDGGPDAHDAHPPPPDVLSDYVDPGCPDKPPPIYDFQCDPYSQQNGDCQPGEGCYIYVQYPSEPCGQEIYGALCAPEGPGSQGSDCGGAQDCSGGFCCVVSGSGNQCVQLCPLNGPDGCPSGLVCEPIDVEGFGGCL